MSALSVGTARGDRRELGGAGRVFIGGREAPELRGKTGEQIAAALRTRRTPAQRLRSKIADDLRRRSR